MVRAAAVSRLVFVAFSVGAAEMPRPDDPSHFTAADKQAILALARRAAAEGEAAFDPATMPAKLLRSTGRPLLLSAHLPGKEPLVAAAAQGTLFEQLRKAALELRATGRLAPLSNVRLKVDIVLDSSPVEPGGRGLPVLGMDGLRVRTGAEELFLPPSEALRLDLADGDAFVRHALEQLKPPAGGPRDVSIERLGTLSFMDREPGGKGPPVDLYRSMPLVEEATRRRLLAACEAAADWLLRSQKPDGSFHYLYNAAKDQVAEGEHEVVRHAGTAWSLAQAYAATGRRRFRDGAYRALEWLLGHARTRGEMAWIEHEGKCPLGAAALAVVALLEYRAAAGARRFDKDIRRLGRFLIFMQRDDGFFWSHYDSKGERGFFPDGYVPLFEPGEAFLALVRLQRTLPDPVWQAAVGKAAEFVLTKRDAWYYEHDLPMIHPDSWTMMALEELHAAGAARRAHADYCFFLAQQILDEQEDAGTARWRDHAGAHRVPIGAPEAAVVAARCEGLLAAWRLARRMGAATNDCRHAILASARFQLAHQVDTANSYLLPNPSRALGGFYASYADHTIRIDYVQHNISSLLGVAQILEAEGGE
jgi:hypothetical protein